MEESQCPMMSRQASLVSLALFNWNEKVYWQKVLTFEHTCACTEAQLAYL